MLKQQKNTQDIPSRNWQIEIDTIFPDKESVSKSFAKNWVNMLNQPIISFIIYKIHYPDKKTDNINISIFLELNGYVRKRKIVRLFDFNDNFVKVEKKYGFSANSIKEIIDKCSDVENELFWKGIPRYNKNVSDETSYSFVVEHNLKKKARKKPRVPSFIEQFTSDESDLLTSD